VIKVVYARATTVLMFGHGRSELVTQGSHWPAEDPLVKSHPGLFSEDPRTGLSFSVPPPADEEEQIELGDLERVKRRYVRRGA